MTYDEAIPVLDEMKTQLEARFKKILPGRQIAAVCDAVKISVLDESDGAADYWHWCLDVNFGWNMEKMFKGEREFTCTINPFTCGSFDPTDRDDNKARYFMLVSEVIGHAFEIKAVLKEYFLKRESIRAQIDPE